MLLLSHFYHNITFIELPNIRPTEYMFEKWSHLGNDKWEVYAEVTREIYCSVGEFEKTNKNFLDMLNYLSEINEKKVTNC